MKIWNFKKWRENGEIRTFSKIRKMAGKRRCIWTVPGRSVKNSQPQRQYDRGKLAAPLNYLWQVTLCQRQSRGMTVVCSCCMPLFNYRWQDINEQLLGTQVDTDLPVGPPPPQPTTPRWRITFMNIFTTKTKIRKIKIITSANVI